MQTDEARRLRVVIADDHDAVLEELSYLIGRHPGLELVGLARNGADAVSLARTLRPDVVIMDVRMPVMDGVEATRWICGHWPAVAVVGMSTQERTTTPHPIEIAGATAYYQKGGDTHELIAHVFAVAWRRNGSPPG